MTVATAGNHSSADSSHDTGDTLTSPLYSPRDFTPPEMQYRSVNDINFEISDLPRVPSPGRVLMTSPDHFEVRYVINPHMAGHIGTVDVTEAAGQWESLKSTYEGLGLDVQTVPGQPGLPDMVFCANQTLPYYDTEKNETGVILSNMYAAERSAEVDYFARYFGSQGYETKSIQSDAGVKFEGMGDAIWHVGRRLLWGGFGFRTSEEVYEKVSSTLNVPVVLLRLNDPDFYHLDTCLSVLDESTALIYPGAFDAGALALIRHFFSRTLEAPEDESRLLFACNAHCPDERNVVIQRGCDRTNALLSEAGFVPVEVETDQFLKAGGSVFCMKQMFW